jgi:hypothetical protein
MSNILRLGFMTVVVLVVVLAAALHQTEFEGNLQNDVLRAARTEPDRKRIIEVIDRRIEQKSKVVNELLAGRLTLFDAAAVFYHLDAQFPVLALSLYAGDSRAERTCHEVIMWAKMQSLKRTPHLTEWVVAQMEEELRIHKERHHAVILPEMAHRE